MQHLQEARPRGADTAAASSMRLRRANRARIDKVHTLVRELSTVTMRNTDIAARLKLSVSGARKLVRYLREAGVIVDISDAGSEGSQACIPAYRTCENRSQVDAFLAELARPKTLPPRPRQVRLGASDMMMMLSNNGEGRQFHIMSYDLPYALRFQNGAAVGRDPLVAALFGPARAN